MNFNKFQADLNAAVNAVLEQHGMAKLQLDIRKYRGTDKKVRIMATDVISLDLAPAPVFASAASTADIDPVLARALKLHGIASVTNDKGDRIVGYKPSRPKYPFSYIGARGGRWKDSVDGIRTRFGVAQTA